MLPVTVKPFSEYVADFKHLAEKSTLSFTEELLPVLVGCDVSLNAPSTETTEQITQAARSIFCIINDIFQKLGDTFSGGEQRTLLAFSVRALTHRTRLPENIFTDLEKAAVKTSLVVTQFSEKYPPRNRGQMHWEFLYVLFPLARELIHLDFKLIPSNEIISLLQQFFFLSLHHMALCGDAEFSLICQAYKTGSAKTCSLPKGNLSIISSWKELLGGVSESLKENSEKKEFFTRVKAARGKAQEHPAHGQDLAQFLGDLLEVVSDHSKGALAEGVFEERIEELADSASERGVSKELKERGHRATLLAECLCSPLLVWRLAAMTMSIGVGMAQAHARLTPGEAAQVLEIFDTLDHLIAKSLQTDPSNRRALSDLRNGTFAEFCTTYPALAIESYRQSRPSNPFTALLPRKPGLPGSV